MAAIGRFRTGGIWIATRVLTPAMVVLSVAGAPLLESLARRVRQILPPGGRMLSDNANLFAALVNVGIDVVPVWSPEVRFLFSAPPDEAERRLEALHIACVAVYPESLNTGYLLSASPFYAALSRRSRTLAQVGNSIYFLAPADH